MRSSKKMKKHSIKLLEWIRKYGGYWWLVCTPGDNRMNMDIARKIITSLAKNGLYEMIFVFLTPGGRVYQKSALISESGFDAGRNQA